MPVAKQSGAKVIGGTLNVSGSFVSAPSASWQRHDAGPDRADGRGRAALARADPAARRSGGRLVRADGHRHCIARLRGLVALRPRAAFRLRPGGGGDGVDHRLPVRPGARDADGDHGGRRPRRAIGRADPQCRGAGADGTGRHAGCRQDRDAHAGQAQGRRHDRRSGVRRGAAPPACCQHRERQRASVGVGHRRSRTGTRACAGASRAFRMRLPARA